MLMSVREILLFACVVALGTWGLREQSFRSRRRLDHQLRRARSLAREVQALRKQQHSLRREAYALRSDRYYVERVARAQLGWRPGSSQPPMGPPGNYPPLDGPPAVLVQHLPGLAPTLPSPAAMPPPQRPSGQELLSWLGYGSVAHFQRKMMQGQQAGVLDAATIGRAQQLVDMLRAMGFPSVKAFQQRNGLAPDGVFGRRTEQRARELLHERGTPRRPDLLAVNGRERGPGG